MSKVQKAELEISYPLVGQGIAHVTVKSTISISIEDVGKKLKLSISLFGYDAKPGLKFHQNPIYSFYGNVIATNAGNIIHEDKRDINMTVLDEDPGEYYQQHGGIGFVSSYDDEIFAVVSLISEATSNIVEMKYLPRPA